MRKDVWTVFMEGLEQWLKISCYLAFVWVGFYSLQFLPVEIADRIIEAFLEYLGI
jgi:hypothetical protein